jgi:hypothetical protein
VARHRFHEDEWDVHLIELDPAENGDRFRHLFDRFWPNSTRIFSTLEGQTRGRLVTDDPEHPKWAVLHEFSGRSTFIGGSPEPSDVAKAVEVFRQARNVNFLLWPEDERQRLLPDGPDSTGIGTHFWDISPDGEVITALVNSVPAGCEVVAMDRGLSERSEWREQIIDTAFGTVDRFLEVSFGLCLVRGREILSEAYAIYSACGWVEIGTYTAEAHREKGYSSITCAHLVRGCDDRGLRPYWYTSSLNEASRSVARKLGFRHMRTSRYRSYFNSSA